jgi:alkylation response protein AidB-like acyl-CoA dehydrogenase
MTESHRSACFCLTEPGAGSDAAAMQTKVEKRGDKYILNGAKCYITNGRDADLLCVFATIDPGKGTKGICCLAVPRETPGIRVGRIEDKMGHRALVVSELFFEDVELTADNLIGAEGQGFKLAMMALDRGRANITAICTAIASAHWTKPRPGPISGCSSASPSAISRACISCWPTCTSR